MNKGWPTLLWSLYNNDYDQAGSFFGVQAADRPLHAIYTLDAKTVTLDNLTGATQAGVTVESKVYDTAGNVLDDQTSAAYSLTSQKVVNGVLTPHVQTTAGTVSFVELLTKQNGTVVDRNVYWIPATGDVMGSKTAGQPQAAMSSYANLKALQSLPSNTAVSATAVSSAAPGPAGSDRQVTVTITNNSTTKVVGFFLRADLRRGTATGGELAGDNELKTSIWSDDDVTLWPGESTTLTATYSSADLQGSTPVVSLSGWNVPKMDVVVN
jgi:exo-1,4-beta-D-glucosaminidase